jgi:CBS domain-containing protein
VSIEEIMHPASACCGVDESLGDASRKFQKHKTTSLPVVDKAGSCCGMVSAHHLDKM